jgi:ribosomal protein L7/L12
LEVEPPTYTLRLLSFDSDRLAVMAAIRALRPELSLSDAKALIEPLPQVIKNDVAHSDVDVVRSGFRDAGAVVEFVDDHYGRVR